MAPKRKTGLPSTERKSGKDKVKVKKPAKTAPFSVDMIDAVPEALIILDDKFLVTGWNLAAEQMYGWSAVEVLGKPLRNFLRSDYGDIRAEDSMNIILKTGHWSGRVAQRRKDGTRIEILSSVSLLKNKTGDISGYLGINRDITEQKQIEERLAESESMLAMAEEVARIGSWKWDIATQKMTWSDEMFHLFELDRESFDGDLNHVLAARVHQDDQKVLKELNGNTLKDGLSFRIVLPNGDERMVWVQGRSILGEPGQPIGFSGYVQDITERKQAINALQESEERYRQTLDNMLEGCQIIGYDWRYLYVNETVAKQGHIRREDLMNHTMMDVYPGIENTELFSILKDCMENRLMKKIENEFTYPDNTRGWFELNIQPVPEGIFILSNDITERKQTEKQLRESEERFRQLANNIEESFYMTDPHSKREIYLSPATSKIWGRGIDELMENTNVFVDSVLPEDRPIILHAMGRQEIGERTSIEYRIKLPSGEIRWVWDRAFPILGEKSTVTFVAGLIADITDRKQTEEKFQTQLRRLNALSAIDNAISASLDMRLTLGIFLRQTIVQLGVDAADVLLLNSSLNRLEYVVGQGFQSQNWGRESLGLGKGLAGRAAMQREKVHVANLAEVNNELTRIPLFDREGFITYFGIPLIAKGQLKGVLEVFHRSQLNPDTEWLDYLNTLAGQAAIAIDNAQLFDGLQRSNIELTMAYDATIAGWSHAMDLRDKETEGHTQRVTDLTIRLAERMGFTPQELAQIRRGALLHDIGKLGVPDQILLKPDKLTSEEWEIMRKHPAYAYEMLLPIAYLKPALDIPYCHHEKWDGSGYPRGLAGEQIPLAARVFAVVDVWDALRSDRPYRAGWSAEKTRAHIQSESGTHFDPRVVEVFLKVIDEMEDDR